MCFFAFKRASFGSEFYITMGPSPPLWFMHAKQRLLDTNTSLYGYQTSPVVLCMQNSVISTRITSLYGSQRSSEVFACKTAIIRAELPVTMGPRPHLSFCEFKTACLASELLVSMGSSPHLWFLDSKHRLLDQNNKSPWVPDITCHFVHAKQRD